ncbi:MAG: hypothetical protein HY815_24705, partial [Candidatus Riflebacteria bacterium]|nr:hypothetical protein [Candidatus Riflebacteria bacterium]
LRDPAISTSSSPTALTGLEWASSGTPVFASFSTDRPAVFALQVEPGGGGAPWTTLEGTAGNAHRLVVTGLEPDRRYRARVLDQAGKVVATRALSTLSLTALADRLIESLRAARVGSLAREIPALVAGALKIRPRSEDLEATWAALRREWEEKIGQAFEQARLDTLAGEFTPHRDQVFTSPEVPVDTRVRLYESIQALRDLEVGAELLRIRMPTLSVSLSSPEYSQVAGPRPGKLAGVAFRFETDPTLLVNEGATTEPLTVRVLPSAIGQLSSLGDPSNPDQFMIDDASHAFFTATEPVALPGARVPRLELRASLDPFEPATGVRVLCSTAADPRPPRAWRLVAHLRPADRGRAVVYHPIPSDLLMERPLFLRFELAFCHALPVVQFNAEQQCRLHWIVLGYEATTRGGREAGR